MFSDEKVRAVLIEHAKKMAAREGYGADEITLNEELIGAVVEFSRAVEIEAYAVAVKKCDELHVKFMRRSYQEFSGELQRKAEGAKACSDAIRSLMPPMSSVEADFSMKWDVEGKK